MKIFREIKKSFVNRMVYYGISNSSLFDKKWYLSQYPEIGKVNPVKHYLEKGWREGKNPSEKFSTNKYLYAYPDVQDRNMNPLEHYLFHGKKRGRLCFNVGQVGIEKAKKTNNRPLVSVIVASYNYADLLPQTLDSILSQTYTNYEIVIVDDGSTDNSMDIINRYLSKNDNIKLYRHPGNANRGLPETVRLGVIKSQGEFVAFCESDDFWDSQHLSKKVDIINRYQEVKIISNNVELFGEEKMVNARKKYVEDLDAFLSVGGNNLDINGHKGMNYIPTFSAVMIRKDVFQNLDYNTPIPAWIDFWLYRQILKNELLFYATDKLTYWRQHSSFNNINNAEKYTAERDWFIYMSNRLNGFKISRRILKNVKILKESHLFELSYYSEKYADLLDGTDPTMHYLLVGWKKGCNPSPYFNNNAYLSNYVDVWLNNVNPLIHYERYGKKQRLKVFPVGTKELLEIQETDIEMVGKWREKTKTVLLISHELSLTGAPRALLNMAIMLKKIGATPVILSLKHGPMEKEISELGIKLLVEPFLLMNYNLRHWPLSGFLSNFDVVVFNTLETVWLIEHFSEIKAKKICWLHEGRYSYAGWTRFKDLSVLFSLFDKVYAVGEYSKSFADPYILDKNKLGVLLYGIPDIEIKLANKTLDNKIKLLLPGTLSDRKGQLILLQALDMLSKKVREQIDIYIVGAAIEKKVERAVKHCHYSCVKYIGELEHEQLLQLFTNVDIALSPSLDDPMPIVCTEAMALEKGVIVSENTGTAGFIENGKNGYKVPAGDPLALAEVIERMVLYKDKLPMLGKAARKIYDDNFTMEIFEKNIKALIMGE